MVRYKGSESQIEFYHTDQVLSELAKQWYKLFPEAQSLLSILSDVPMSTSHKFHSEVTAAIPQQQDLLTVT